EDQGAEENLERSEPEDETAQGPQALPGQLDADSEKEEDHAEFGDVRGPLRIGEGQPVDPRVCRNQPAEPVGTEQGAHAKKAQDRTDPEPMKEGNDDARGCKEEDRFLIRLQIDGGC